MVRVDFEELEIEGTVSETPGLPAIHFDCSG
jgi:hypothetical protein